MTQICIAKRRRLIITCLWIGTGILSSLLALGWQKYLDYTTNGPVIGALGNSAIK